MPGTTLPSFAGASVELRGNGSATQATVSLQTEVRQLVAGKGFTFVDRGETEMRGFEERVRLHEVRWN